MTLEPAPAPVPAPPASQARPWIVAAALLAAVGAGAALGQALAAFALPSDSAGVGAAIGAVVAAVLAPSAFGLALRQRPAPPAPLPAPVPGAQRAVRDPLTGAYTQPHFVAAADREWARLRRRGEDAALLMVDIDRFDRLNDAHGPDFGDAMLAEVTRQAVGTLRPYDLLARFGGGVLVVYLPNTDPIGALDVAERIRERVAALRLTQDGKTVTTTVSVGVAPIGEAHAGIDAVVTDAGAALRDAKAAGRNCVRSMPIPPRRSPSSGAITGDRRRAGPV
jgi:diguanylate cyclase (GGDEF)-like protein